MTESKSLGELITFYSYKGGTGRTMALANVACLLAQRSSRDERVLVIDWDLEAPGLHKYFQPYLSTYGTSASAKQSRFEQRPGLIDLLSDIDRLISKHKTPQREFPSICEELGFSKYIAQTDINALDILKAGRFDINYSTCVNKFEWEVYYQRNPWLIHALVEELTRRYRYVLVDSRTGLTDISGICTMLIPEKLVAVFTPNNQSLSGCIDIVRQAIAYRRQSDDLRPLMVYPLPSRIEAAEPTLKQSWRYGDDQSPQVIAGYQPLFESLLKAVYGLPECGLQRYFDDVQVQHVPRYAYGEAIAVLVERSTDRLSIAQSYATFLEYLIRPARPWDAIDPDTASYVFLSYSARDLSIVQYFAAGLEKRGVRCWYDARNITPGTDWARSITGAIEKSRVMVVFVSEAARDSMHVNHEVVVAAEHSITILPVILPGTDENALSGAMQHYLGRRQWIKLQEENVDQSVERLASAISRLSPA